MKSIYIAGMLIALAACSNQEVVSPTPVVTKSPEVATSTPTITFNPVVNTPTSTTVDVGVEDSGKFFVKNLSGQVQTYHIYSYKVLLGGEQSQLDHQTATIQNNDVFYGQIAVTNCFTQVDVSNIPPTNKINPGELYSKYIHQGQFCIPACIVEWISLPPVTTYTDWSTCSLNDNLVPTCTTTCTQTRKKIITYNEKNSCTGEIRLKLSRTTTEARSCECPKKKRK